MKLRQVYLKLAVFLYWLLTQSEYINLTCSDFLLQIQVCESKHSYVCTHTTVWTHQVYDETYLCLMPTIYLDGTESVMWWESNLAEFYIVTKLTVAVASWLAHQLHSSQQPSHSTFIFVHVRQQISSALTHGL